MLTRGHVDLIEVEIPAKRQVCRDFGARHEQGQRACQVRSEPILVRIARTVVASRISHHVIGAGLCLAHVQDLSRLIGLECGEVVFTQGWRLAIPDVQLVGVEWIAPIELEGQMLTGGYIDLIEIEIAYERQILGNLATRN